MPIRSILLIAGIVLSSCATFKTSHQPVGSTATEKQEPLHSIYLLGNTTAANYLSKDDLVLNDLISQGGGSQTVVLLGDNIGSTSFEVDSARSPVNDNISLFSDLEADLYFVAGEEEWGSGSRKGQRRVALAEYYLEELRDLGNVMLPDKGCPGPEEISIGDDIVLLLINTQWWLHEWEKPGEEEGCEVANEIDFLNNLKDALVRNHNKKIIVAGHHSMYSSGRHGGYFPWRAHLFPFTLANDNLYLPLPVAGSLYIGFRSLFGGYQDLKNYKYQRMRKELTEIFATHENLIYASAHEPALEYQHKGTNHYINSGTFSGGEPVGNTDADFVSSHQGFARLDFNEIGEVWLSFWLANGSVSPLYRERLFRTASSDKEKKLFEDTDYSDSTINTCVTRDYIKKSSRPGMMGQNYRKEWATVVNNIRYFDLGKEKGGMEIDKKGGGMQTRSLRLKGNDGKEYVLRSMKKYPESVVPVELRGTFAENLIIEQISASHPYGAFTVPPLADAAGVYHTNPEWVYLPEDPRLGIYHDFGGALYLYEERPDDDRTDVESFGRPKEIISTDDVINKLMKDGDHEIDQDLVVRSRLFDIMIGDWDRHEDQWRWARFKKEDDMKFYQPIPRDRDNVYFWSDGWLMKVGTRRWGMPKFQGFHHKIRDVAGLNFNARYFDRTFTNETDLGDWLRIANDLKNRISDEAIEKAIREMPAEIFELHGKEIISKLKTRRDDLPEYAKEHYLFLAKTVDVVGTEKRDLFEIERLDDLRTRVVSYRIKNKSGEIKYKTYERTFLDSETDEIRIYGLGEDDIFKLEGTVREGVKIRVIGGKGKDEITNRSNVKGWGKKTLVYDKKSGTRITTEGDTKNRTTDKDPLINEYDRKSFQYNLAAPLLYGGYNPDDGIFVGLGAFIKTHGFRKDPFKTSHFIVGNIAPKSASFNITYRGTFTEILGKWSANLHAIAFYPSYSNFFYGFGNETPMDKSLRKQDVRYYAARFQQIMLRPELFRVSEDEHHRICFGTGYQLINVKKSRNNNENGGERFIHAYARTVDHEIFDEWRQYISAYAQYEFDTRNNNLYPQRGLYFNLKSGYAQDLDDNAYGVSYSFTASQFSFYHTFGNTFRTTLAARAGGEANFGDYEFYHANTLGGSENMRGYRKHRFAGDAAFYQNTDLRIRLFSFRSIILPGDVGLTFFHDLGRVWMDDDPSTARGDSELWHRGYGAGVFLVPFGKAAITLDYSRSNTNESAVFVRLGFLF